MPINEQFLPGLGFNKESSFYSNYFDEHNIVQQTAVTHPKTLLIGCLKSYFSNDNLYTYKCDEYGFPLVRDVTGYETDDEDASTKILISDIYNHEIKFFPSIVVKCNGGAYRPLSFNQNGTYKSREHKVVDSFGTEMLMKIPSHKVYTGAWEINFDINIMTESQRELEELVDIVSLLLQYSAWNELRAAGLFIKNLNIGAESAEEYANDYIYNQNISLSTRSEWRVEIPILNLVEKVVFKLESKKTPNNFNIFDQPDINSKFKDIVESV